MGSKVKNNAYLPGLLRWTGGGGGRVVTAALEQN